MILHEKLSIPYEKIKWKESVSVLCDYCGKEITKTKQKIQKGRKTIQKDSCSNDNCTKKKLAEINLLKHGVANSFQRSDVKEKIKKTNLQRHGVEYAQQSEEIRAKSRATCLKNYGVEHALKNNEILKKAQNKSLEKYGTRFPIQLDEFKEKVRKTNIYKFGVEDFLSSELAKKKIKQTNIKKYGVEHVFQSPVIRKKIKSTIIEKYNVDNCFKSDEIKKKIKDTNLKKYGVDHPSKSEIIQEKTKKTNLKKYGYENPSKNSEVRKKTVKTNIKKYGVKCNLSLPQTKEKIKKTNLERYGVECTLKHPEIKNKIKETNLRKYGCEHTFSSKEIREKSIKTKIDRYGKPYPSFKFGKTQKEITDWLNSYGFNFKSDFEILEGKELDCYDINQKFALEYCGIYWHNENSPQPRNRLYHYNKWKKCKDNGIQLLTIFDDEWNNKKEICKSLILSKLGIFEKRIYARKCEVRKISKKEMSEFCDLYHLQGANKLSIVCFGLFHKNELCAVIDLGRHHRKKDKETLVLTRLCFKSGLQVVGGAGKLFKYCIDYCKENNIKNIVSWSDNRYSDGNIYEKLGFEKVEDLKPDYYYVNVKNPKKRLSKQSQSKKNSNCPKEMTELEWANSRGLSRIWDCGKTRWKKILPN